MHNVSVEPFRWKNLSKDVVCLYPAVGEARGSRAPGNLKRCWWKKVNPSNERSCLSVHPRTRLPCGRGPGCRWRSDGFTFFIGVTHQHPMGVSGRDSNIQISEVVQEAIPRF